MMRCPLCEGEGKRVVYKGFGMVFVVPCNACYGSGAIDPTDARDYEIEYVEGYKCKPDGTPILG